MPKQTSESISVDVYAAFVEILGECERRGMVPPFILVSASRNGSVLAIRVPGDGSEGQVLAEHFEDGMFRTPVTCMLLDQQGEVMRVNIDLEEVTYH